MINNKQSLWTPGKLVGLLILCGGFSLSLIILSKINLFQLESKQTLNVNNVAAKVETQQRVKEFKTAMLKSWQGEAQVKGFSDGSIHFWNIYHLWENVKGNNPVRSLTMKQEKQERIKACLQELSTLLYEEADKSKLTDLEGIEKTVRSQVLELVSPEIALFLSNKKQEQK